MKAAVMSAAGVVPEYQDFPEPEAGEGRELVELVAAGIHPVVRAKASGTHYSSSGPWPQVPGVDAVVRTSDGTEVYTGGFEPPYGTFAERMAVMCGMYVPLPAGADAVAVAGGMNPGLSSWVPLKLHATEHGTPGTVVVLGATGMAGGLAVQNARALGAQRVIAAGRNPEALEHVAALGATTVALTGDGEKDAAALVSALDGQSPDLVLDFVWGGPAESMFRALEDTREAPFTGYVQIGSLAGDQAAVPASLLRSRPFRLTGSGIGSFSMIDYIGQMPAYLQLIAAGTVQVRTQQFPLSQVGEAWTVAEGGPRPVLIGG